MPLSVMWPLTRRWYGDRLDPDFRPASRDTLQGLLDDAGLVDPFWQLTPPSG